MDGQEGRSSGDSQQLKREGLNNGLGIGIKHNFVDGNLGLSDGFRTYKRRKHARLSSEGKSLEDWTNSVEAASKIEEQNLRNVVLEHLYQSISDDEGGIQGCIREALAFHSEIDCTTIGSNTLNEFRNRCSKTRIPNGTQYSANSHVDVISDEPLNESDHRINTDLCQRAFLDIITSEKFTLLCKVLLENFQGMKINRLFDLSAINTRMKSEIYESAPMLFVADVQQVWRKFQDIGAEIITLAESLSELSRTSYNEHVRDLALHIFGEGKNETVSWESVSDFKAEQTVACDVYKVRTCRHCEEKADEKNCLVCDSCEEMYHITCIQPAVKEIPLKSWYCGTCTAKGIGSPHENYVVCQRLNASAPRNAINQAGDEICPTNGETSTECEENSNCSTDDAVKLSGDTTGLYVCKICRIELTSSDKFRVCGHPYCFNKLYHERCLTEQQLKYYGPRWFCPSCLCRGCLTDRDDDKIVLCDSCDQAYHIYCMKPPHTSIPSGRWFCRKCDAGIQEIRRVKKALENKLKKKCEEESDKSRGGMDMLLHAASTLNFLRDGCS